MAGRASEAHRGCKGSRLGYHSLDRLNGSLRCLRRKHKTRGLHAGGAKVSTCRTLKWHLKSDMDGKGSIRIKPRYKKHEDHECIITSHPHRIHRVETRVSSGSLNVSNSDLWERFPPSGLALTALERPKTSPSNIEENSAFLPPITSSTRASTSFLSENTNFYHLHILYKFEL